MCELVVDTVVRYEALVPSYLDFVRQHRGRRTTHQLENALGRFVQWMTTTGGLTGLYQLTPVVLRRTSPRCISFAGRRSRCTPPRCGAARLSPAARTRGDRSRPSGRAAAARRDQRASTRVGQTDCGEAARVCRSLHTTRQARLRHAAAGRPLRPAVQGHPDASPGGHPLARAADRVGPVEDPAAGRASAARRRR